MEKKKAYVVLSLLLVALLGCAYLLFSNSSLPNFPLFGPQPEAAPAAPSQEVIAMVTQSKGFAALVSYTDAGFQPTEVTIKKGEAIRFINNSNGQLWIAATSTAAAYPGSSECGGSAFDTCKALTKGEFWEFTFDAKGSWHYRNNSDPEKTGTITVQ